MIDRRIARVGAALVAFVLVGLAALGPGAVGGAAQQQQDPMLSDACRTVFQTPVHAGDPVISQVILVATGEVIATRTGDGPYVPADFMRRCEPASTTAPAAAEAAPAEPAPGTPTFTG